MIEIKNLGFVYQEGMPGEREALRNISLTIDEGETVAVIGHTGSGKSTLAELMSGLLKPSSGQILLDGEDIAGLDRLSICKKIGLVFQYPEQQLFEETVYRDIAFGPENLRLGEAKIKEQVIEAVRAVGLDEMSLGKSPFELSGGERRRAAIAGILAMSPGILIMDEPMAGLDPSGRSDMLKLIKNMQKKNMTVIFISHSMEDVAAVAERVIVMNNGEIETDGSVREVFSKGKRLLEIGLDIPQMTRLAKELRRRGYDVSEEIYTVQDMSAEIKRLMKGYKNV